MQSKELYLHDYTFQTVNICFDLVGPGGMARGSQPIGKQVPLISNLFSTPASSVRMSFSLNQTPRQDFEKSIGDSQEERGRQ